jgi:hypothetical protein
MTLGLKSAWLDRAYRVYFDDWLWDEWFYLRGWSRRFPEMILWYSTAGSAALNETAADTFVRTVRAGRPLPVRRRNTWRDALRLTSTICEEQATNPVDWFTGGCGILERGWWQLDEIFGIGPKIASFIMRDLSFMRDYSVGQGGASVAFRNRRDSRWFADLSIEDQALFLPVDVYVHEGARRDRASALCMSYADVRDIQADPELHRLAGSEIVRWARKRGFDPRAVNAYWYQVGAEAIRLDGSPV